MTQNAPVNDYFAATVTAPPQSTPIATAPAASTETAPRLFRRSRTDRMLGGVCGGLAETLGVDAAVLRIALVAATVLGFGAAAVIYVVCWIVVPEAPEAHAALTPETPMSPVSPASPAPPATM